MPDPTDEELEELRRTLQTQVWTSHNIKLADDLMTMPGAPDFMTTDTRLAAIRRIIRTRFGNDISGLTVADLGCLEGGFALALALEGADVVGIEAREANLAKAELLGRWFNLKNLTFQLADVKTFTAEAFGSFDVVLALGIAYHLDRPAAWLHQIAKATKTLLVIDSHFAPADDAALAAMQADIRGLSALEVESGTNYPGRWYSEFEEHISSTALEAQQWASWSNHRSFWLTEESILLALVNAGFDNVTQQHDATVGAYGYFRDKFCRGMYVAQRSQGPQTSALTK